MARMKVGSRRDDVSVMAGCGEMNCSLSKSRIGCRKTQKTQKDTEWVLRTTTAQDKHRMTQIIKVQRGLITIESWTSIFEQVRKAYIETVIYNIT